MDKGCDNNPEIDRIAGEIERYLEAHPGAADSCEGIATWWLPRQRLTDNVERVVKALEKLEHEGLVVRDRLHGGTVVYRRRPTGANTKN